MATWTKIPVTSGAGKEYLVLSSVKDSVKVIIPTTEYKKSNLATIVAGFDFASSLACPLWASDASKWVKGMREGNPTFSTFSFGRVGNHFGFWPFKAVAVGEDDMLDDTLVIEPSVVEAPILKAKTKPKVGLGT